MRIRELFESFDQTYEIFRKSPTEYGFRTDEGEEYHIHFQQAKNSTDIRLMMEYQERYFDLMPANPSAVAEVEFSLDGKFKYLGGSKQISGVKGNPMKIFATVINTVFWFVNSNNIDVIFFSGESQLGAVYERLTKRFAPIHFQVVSRKVGGITRFMIYKRGMTLQ